MTALVTTRPKVARLFRSMANPPWKTVVAAFALADERKQRDNDMGSYCADQWVL